jgi:release factor glutamine methyltransferase
MTIRKALYNATKPLRRISKSPSLDAEVLLCHLFKTDKTRLYQNLNKQITQNQLKRYRKLILRRKQHEPIAYITKHKEFYGLDFYIDKRALIPRSETETLVEETLKLLLSFYKLKNLKGLRKTIADVGTGSGCIAVALAKNLPKSKIYATDISKNALKIAKINIQKFKLQKQIKLLHGDLLKPLKERVDIIVANLPYLTLDQLNVTEEEIKRYEPKIALLAGEVETKLYEKLLKQATKYLKRRGLIVLEIDPKFITKITGIIKERFPKSKLKIKKDLAGLDRVVQIIPR